MKGVITIGALLACAVVTASAGGASQPRVLVIGDSISTAVYWYAPTTEIVQKNLAVQWQVAICRRLVGTSCYEDGEAPPTLVDVVDAMPSVPPTVVVEEGYNDLEDTFPAAVDQTMQTLLAKGAKHVLWLTLREARDPYPLLNRDLRAALARWPQLQLVDWNADSAGHNDWFQSDGVHLTYQGGIGLAHVMHGSLTALLEPLRVVRRGLALRPGRTVDTALQATGGTAPYRWRVASGRPPRGVHLLQSGRVLGRTPRTSHAAFEVQVTDADGDVAYASVSVSS
ncbi:MAG TPA: hypothetical protein VHC01_12085 [Gaiellaceae bacterium]|jgi:hypothetical protein|nr:hypothetical protein [Gaiellaceae bacterium]